MQQAGGRNIRVPPVSGKLQAVSAVKGTIRMPGDHELLIRRYNENLAGTVGSGDRLGMALIKCRVELDTEIGESLADEVTDWRSLFSDAAGKNKGVQPFEYGR